jgi:fructosamine-3-kinase
MDKENVLSILWQVLGEEPSIYDLRPIGGGNISRAYAVKTSKGNFFIKTNRAGLVDMFEKETNNFDWLKKAIPDATPSIVGYGTSDHRSFFVLQLIQAGRKSTTFWADFGRTLAQLHQYSHPQFGLDYNNYIGTFQQDNQYKSNWIDFFIENRLQPQALQASELLGTEVMQQLDKLYNRLPELLTQGKPSLLHGDLWSGNFTVNEKGGVCLVDPATYFGNREIEIAFTKLFGGFEEDFYAAYQEVLPLDKGFFDSRVDIYNLYPLLVHVNLFGGWYIAQVRETLKRFV